MSIQVDVVRIMYDFEKYMELFDEDADVNKLIDDYFKQLIEKTEETEHNIDLLERAEETIRNVYGH